MSKIFYDKLVNLEKVERQIKKVVNDHDEKHELWRIIDELIHHRIFLCIFDNLPKDKHDEFLEKFKKSPFDDRLLNYLTKEVKKDIEVLIKYEIEKVELEL